MNPIKWVMYRISGPDDLKQLERRLRDCYRSREPSKGESFRIFVSLFEELYKGSSYAPMVLAKLFSKSPLNLSITKEEILDAYFSKDWIARLTLSPSRKGITSWKKNPKSVSDLVVIFALNNRAIIDDPRFREFLVHLTRKRLLGRYINSRDPDFTLKALDALEDAEEVERWYIGERPYWNHLTNLLYSNSKVLIERAISILGRMPFMIELDSKFFVRYLSWKGIRKYKGIESEVRRIIVAMGPKVVYALDYKTQKIPIHSDDKWFTHQIALTAAEMTKNFPEPFEGARLLESWVRRHAHKRIENTESYYREMQYQVLYDVLARSLGIERALNVPYQHFPSLDRPERLKVEFKKCEFFNEVIMILKDTGSPILEGILEDYLKWTIGTVLDAIRPEIVVSEEDVRFLGIFPLPDKHAEFILSYLKDTPHWKAILDYLLTLGNELAIRIGLDLVGNDLILRFTPSLGTLDQPRRRDYDESLVRDVVLMVKLSKNPILVMDLLRNAPSLLENPRIQKSLRRQG